MSKIEFKLDNLLRLQELPDYVDITLNGVTARYKLVDTNNNKKINSPIIKKGLVDLK